jgi:DNA-binding response OmpR family regulator
MNQKKRILIVEDETSVAMMMVYLLVHAGCEVEVAENADKAMRLAQDQKFDLITLDIDLPGGSGFEIFARLKKLTRWQNPPVVFVSGRSYDEDQQRARALGAVDYILKPFDALGFASRLLSHIKIKNNSAPVEALA